MDFSSRIVALLVLAACSRRLHPVGLSPSVVLASASNGGAPGEVTCAVGTRDGMLIVRSTIRGVDGETSTVSTSNVLACEPVTRTCTADFGFEEGLPITLADSTKLAVQARAYLVPAGAEALTGHALSLDSLRNDQGNRNK